MLRNSSSWLAFVLCGNALFSTQLKKKKQANEQTNLLHLHCIFTNADGARCLWWYIFLYSCKICIDFLIVTISICLFLLIPSKRRTLCCCTADYLPTLETSPHWVLLNTFAAAWWNCQALWVLEIVFVSLVSFFFSFPTLLSGVVHHG